jgi:hypothetical protein
MTADLKRAGFFPRMPQLVIPVKWLLLHPGPTRRNMHSEHGIEASYVSPLKTKDGQVAIRCLQ